MAMLERNAIGKQVRKYFIEVEKRYKENIMPKDFPSALRAYADEVERRQIAEQEKEKLQQELGYSKEWLSIKRVATMNGVEAQPCLCSAMGITGLHHLLKTL